MQEQLRNPEFQLLTSIVRALLRKLIVPVNPTKRPLCPKTFLIVLVLLQNTVRSQTSNSALYATEFSTWPEWPPVPELPKDLSLNCGLPPFLVASAIDKLMGSDKWDDLVYILLELTEEFELRLDDFVEKCEMANPKKRRVRGKSHPAQLYGCNGKVVCTPSQSVEPPARFQ